MRTVPVRTYYIEMKERPSINYDAPHSEISFRKIEKISAKDYLKLYISVGGPYGWFDRILMDRTELEEIIDDPLTEIYLLSRKGEVVGYSEIRREDEEGDVEIVFLGIREGFLSIGYGRYLLERTLEAAWKGETSRVWLHTCEWDHESALPMYLRKGFVMFDEKYVDQKVPDDFQKDMKR